MNLILGQLTIGLLTIGLLTISVLIISILTIGIYLLISESYIYRFLIINININTTYYNVNVII